MKIKLNLFLTTLVLITTLMFFGITDVDAATANVSITANKTQVVVGNSVTFTVKVSSTVAIGAWNYEVNYDTSKLTFTGGSGLANAYVASNGSTKSVSFTFTFKAKASGTANMNFIVNELVDWDNGSELSCAERTSKSVKIITQSELEASYSKNNDLSSLAVTGFNLSPTFNKDVNTYTVTVPNATKEVTIAATKADSKSSVSGTGTKQVTEGSNKFEIKVTAQNGLSQVYTINVIVEELTPIEITLNNEKFTVVRKKDLLTTPNNTFKDYTVTINKLEVPAFKSTITNNILVGLKNSDGEISLYLYNEKEDTYSKYKEFVFGKTILNIQNNYKELSDKYIKTTYILDEEEITAYKVSDDSHYYLFYGMNVETGETNLYRYEQGERSVQLFFDEAKEIIENNSNALYLYIIIGLGVFLIITYFVILVILMKKSKKVKRIKQSN